MPLPMVHLCVAERLVNPFKIKDKSSFYLGAIAPDSVHMRENFKREQKKISHINTQDKSMWEDNTLDFIRNNKDEFYLGYGIHILTDIIWNKTIFEDFKLKYFQDTSPIQDQTMAYYNDTDKLDFELYEKFPRRKQIWEYLANSHGIDIDSILSSTEINAWTARTLNWYCSGESQHKNPIKYITYNDLISFVDKTALNIKNMIINMD